MLPWIQALAAAIAATPELIKLGKGFSDRKKAKKIMNDTERPVRYTNEYYKDFLSNTRGEAFTTGLPGESNYIDQLKNSQAATMSQISQTQQSPTAMMRGFLSTQDNTNNGLLDIENKGIDYRTRMMSEYYRALLTNAQQEDLNWQWNQAGPYDDAMKTASALFNSGQQNMFNGANGLANVGTSFLGGIAGGGGGSSAGTGTGNKLFSSDNNNLSNTYDMGELRRNLERVYGPMNDQQFSQYLQNANQQQNGQ